MPKRIYVGNLPFSASDDEVRQMGERHGRVQQVRVKADKANENAMAVIVFEGEGPNTVVAYLNGRKVGGNIIVASDDRSAIPGFLSMEDLE